MPGADDSEYPPWSCNHAEFDTRVLLHAANAVSHGYNRILIIAKDADVIVLGIYRSSVIFPFMTSAV